MGGVIEKMLGSALLHPLLLLPFLLLRVESSGHLRGAPPGIETLAAVEAAEFRHRLSFSWFQEKRRFS